MKPNPDNRKDNAKKIKQNIDNTLQNIELGEEMMGKTSDKKLREALEDKNARREKAIKGMRQELKDESGK